MMGTVVCQRCGETIVTEPGATMAFHRCNPELLMPSVPQRVWNLAKAVAEFVADGCKTVSAEEYAARLAVCDTCDRRKGVWCKHRKCGCNRLIKAKGRAWKCPMNKWPV